MDDLRVWIPRGVLVVFVLSFGPGIVSAHGVTGSRFRSPLPLSLLLAGAGATVAVTALWMALRERSTAPTERRRRVLSVPSSIARPVRYGMGGIFLAGVGAALLVGVLGRQVPAENFATVFTWPVWFRGVALLAVVFGSPWRSISPWRTLYRGLVWLEGRTPAVGTYPSVFAEWPAAVGFVVLIGIVENLTVIPRSPRLTTVILAVYGLVMVGGATLYGPTWLRRVDPLGVFYRLFGRVAPIDASSDDGGYAITLRPPWQGCLDPLGSVPLVVFVVATVYTVSFDGFTDTRLFQTVLFGVRDTLGTGSETSILLYVVGLAFFVFTFGVGTWVVEWLGAGTPREWIPAARWFAPTVLPIAAGYEVAHNYPYVIRNFGQLLVISVPGLESINLLGWLSLPVFWGSQVVLIVFGHVIAVVAAHYVALKRYDTPARARRGHLPFVVLMVGYTVLSLWIISRPVIAG